MKTTSRREFLQAAGACGLASAVGRVPGAAIKSPPNIVFILADDWGWGDLGCYGNDRIRTPNIDRLASEGVSFRQFYAQSAVCSPTRASFMTGLFTNNHGIHSHIGDSRVSNQRRNLPNYLDPDLPTLPRLLRQAGYATAHYGKWHLTAPEAVEAPSPERYGFDHHRVCVGSGDGVHKRPEAVPGWNVWDGARPGPNWNEWRAQASRHIFDETIGFIEQNKDQPFYVQSWMFDTHAILTPDEKQREPFKNLPSTYQTYYSAAYDSDRHVGRLLGMLEERGLAENTIVIFSSDNGPEEISLEEASEFGVGDPGPFRGRKRSGYEGGIRMPFIVRWPKAVPAGRVDESTILGGVDLLPSLCAAAGIENAPMDQIDGLDMLRAIHGTPIERPEPLFWELHEEVIGPRINVSPQLVVRDGRWKLLMHRDGSGVELYDIVANPLEVDNLADTHPQVVERLSRMLMNWHKKTSPVLRG